MTSDKPQPSPQDQPRRTMCPELQELLKDPIFRRKSSPQGGGIIITGVGPQSRPPETKPADTEPRKPESEADDDRR